MTGSNRRDAPSRWTILAGSLIVLLVCATGLSVLTFAARLTELDADRVEIAAATVTVDDRGDTAHLDARLRFHNPTPHAVTLVYGQLTAASDGTQLTRRTTTPFDRRVVVPSSGAATVRTELPIRDGRLEAARAALASDEVVIRGQVRATVVREPIEIDVGTGEVTRS